MDQKTYENESRNIQREVLRLQRSYDETYELRKAVLKKEESKANSDRDIGRLLETTEENWRYNHGLTGCEYLFREQQELIKNIALKRNDFLSEGARAFDKNLRQIENEIDKLKKNQYRLDERYEYEKRNGEA